jgi:hypothetical protein
VGVEIYAVSFKISVQNTLSSPSGIFLIHPFQNFNNLYWYLTPGTLDPLISLLSFESLFCLLELVVFRHQLPLRRRRLSWHKLPGPNDLERGPTMLYILLSFLMVSLFVNCPNYPFQTKPKSLHNWQSIFQIPCKFFSWSVLAWWRQKIFHIGPNLL